MKKNDSRLIPGRTRFLSPVHVEDLAVRGLIDEVRLEDFLETLVTTDSDRRITGRWEFLDDVVISGLLPFLSLRVVQWTGELGCRAMTVFSDWPVSIFP